MNLCDQRILITGASGFLGRHLVARLRQVGCRQLFLPRSTEFDLTRADDVRRLLADAQPEIVVHLAARVGGIGANRRQPGTFAYQNLIMGTLLIEECRRAGIDRFALAGLTRSHPQLTPAPLRETAPWDG